MDPVQLAARLIDIPSITGSESSVAKEIEKLCVDSGYSVDRQYVSENRWNLWVNWPSQTDVAFCTHLDTVPPFFESSFSEGYLHGRGACDTKGIIAAMIAAGHHIKNQGGCPSYLFVVGEETDSIGAKQAVEFGRAAEFIIIGEPTGNMLAAAHKGVLSYEVRTSGISAHSAYPDRGVSAVHTLLDVLYELRRADWGFDAVLGSSTLNIGRIEGGIAPNVLAADASAMVVHRIVDSLDSRLNQARSILGEKATMELRAANDPQYMHVPSGYDSIGVSFGTDVPYLRAIATPLLCGPGSIHDAHTKTEKISVAAIHDAVDLYVNLYNDLRSSASK